MILLTLAALAGQTPAAPDPAVARMAALFDEVCLKAFPADDRVDAAMAAHGATPLTPEQVKVTMRDDPARGWSIPDGDKRITVFLELPPFHACSVRRDTAAGMADPTPYRAVVDPFEAAAPGFAPIAPFEGDVRGQHVHAVGERRILTDGSGESLLVIDQHPTDPALHPTERVDLRFVRQMTGPRGGGT